MDSCKRKWKGSSVARLFQGETGAVCVVDRCRVSLSLLLV